MNIYYKNELILQNIPKEKINEEIDNFIEKEKTIYQKLYEKTKNLLKKIENIRPKQLGEFNEEYLHFLKENYKDSLLELEFIGKEFYKKDFIDIYFENSKNTLVGFIFKNKNGAIEKISIVPFLLNISIKIPDEKNFKIKD